mmetsp:Transcript_1572/g.2713  ORF Transcript_1572/g.2713 Transcript_1572/m.2713 type:complete len:118 (-) Transcript_1572:700-1053(-)
MVFYEWWLPTLCGLTQLVLSTRWFRVSSGPLASNPVVINDDNQDSGHLASTVVSNERSKHKERHRLIRQKVAAKEHRLDYVPTTTNLSDDFTEVLPREPYNKHSRLIRRGECSFVTI